MKRNVVVLLALGLVAAGAGPALAGLILNGGFEEGDFAGSGGSVSPIPHWDGGNETFATDDSDFPHGGFGPHLGSAYAAFGAIGELDSISQTISTSPGQLYVLDYWFASDGNALNEFKVMWDGVVLFHESNVPMHDYVEYAFLVEGTGSNTVTFAGRDDTGYLSLDDVDLTPSADPGVVPEPASVTLLGIGIAGLIACRWRRKQTSLRVEL